MVATAKTDKKQKDHLFKPGKSGNPKGRPVGCRNKATILLQQMLDGQSEALMQKAIEESLNGDSQMLRGLIDKLLPNAKDKPLSVTLPDVEGTRDISRLTAAVLKAVGSGILTPVEAIGISRVIDVHARTLELTELDERLRKLEHIMKDKKK